MFPEKEPGLLWFHSKIPEDYNVVKLISAAFIVYAQKRDVNQRLVNAHETKGTEPRGTDLQMSKRLRGRVLLQLDCVQERQSGGRNKKKMIF